MGRWCDCNPTKLDDWYTITLSDLRGAGFPFSVTKTEIAELLSEKYPDHRWEKVYLLRGRYALQRRLENSVVALFPVPARFVALPRTLMSSSIGRENVWSSMRAEERAS